MKQKKTPKPPKRALVVGAKIVSDKSKVWGKSWDFSSFFSICFPFSPSEPRCARPAGRKLRASAQADARHKKSNGIQALASALRARAGGTLSGASSVLGLGRLFGSPGLGHRGSWRLGPPPPDISKARLAHTPFSRRITWRSILLAIGALRATPARPPDFPRHPRPLVPPPFLPSQARPPRLLPFPLARTAARRDALREGGEPDAPAPAPCWRRGGGLPRAGPEALPPRAPLLRRLGPGALLSSPSLSSPSRRSSSRSRPEPPADSTGTTTRRSLSGPRETTSEPTSRLAGSRPPDGRLLASSARSGSQGGRLRSSSALSGSRDGRVRSLSSLSASSFLAPRAWSRAKTPPRRAPGP